MKLYSTIEAAEYLGCYKDNITYHRMKGNLEGVRIGNSFGYTMEELERFKSQFQAEGLTKKQIAEEFGVTPSLISYYQQKGRLEPLGKSGQSWVFAREDVERVLADRRDAEE